MPETKISQPPSTIKLNSTITYKSLILNFFLRLFLPCKKVTEHLDTN